MLVDADAAGVGRRTVSSVVVQRLVAQPRDRRRTSRYLTTPTTLGLERRRAAGYTSQGLMPAVSIADSSERGTAPRVCTSSAPARGFSTTTTAATQVATGLGTRTPTGCRVIIIKPLTASDDGERAIRPAPFPPWLSPSGRARHTTREAASASRAPSTASTWRPDMAAIATALSPASRTCCGLDPRRMPFSRGCSAPTRCAATIRRSCARPRAVSQAFGRVRRHRHGAPVVIER